MSDRHLISIAELEAENAELKATIKRVEDEIESYFDYPWSMVNRAEVYRKFKEALLNQQEQDDE